MSPFMRAAIREILSESLTVTNPRGPVTTIEGGGDAYAFDLALSYGHGNGVAGELPPHAEFDDWWFSPTAGADIATRSQVREWPVLIPLRRIGLVVRIDSADVVEGSPGGVQYFFTVTVDGEETDCEVYISGGAISDITLSSEIDLLVAPTSKIGLKAQPGNNYASGYLRCEARIYGIEDTDTGPLIIPELTIQWETAQRDDLAPIELDGANVAVWPNQTPLGDVFDLVPDEDADPLTYVAADPDDGLPYVAGDAVLKRILRTRTPSTAYWDPVDGFRYAPFHIFLAVRMTSSGTPQFRTTLLSFNNPNRLQFFLPLLASFNLFSQFGEDSSTNIATDGDFTPFLSNLWLNLEIAWDGATLSLVRNGSTIALLNAANMTTAGLPAVLGNIITLGNPTTPDIIEPVNGRYRGLFNYKRELTAGEIAKQRAYMAATYPPT